MNKDVIGAIESIQNKISSNILFFSGRLGSVEAKVLLKTQMPSDILASSIKYKNLRKEAWINAGIWPPTIDQMERFSDRYAKAIQNVTQMAVWNSPAKLPGEDKLLMAHNPSCERIPLRVLDPVQLAGQGYPSWTAALEGKKVLVVHPFGELILAQYSKYLTLHSKPLLPNLNLRVIKPPQSNGLNFSLNSWSKNLAEFENKLDGELLKFKPEIALVAAGAYGMPIAHNIYVRNISSMYIGGSLQLIFGIWGSRWKTNSDILKIATDNWITPQKEQRPKGSFLIENSCYW